MDMKPIKMKKDHFGHCWIEFENNLTGTFISTSRALKPEKLLDSTLHENGMTTLSHLAWHVLYDLISMIQGTLKIMDCQCKEM